MFNSLSAAIALFFLGLTSASTINITNACSYSVDPAFSPAANASSGLTGGFALAAGASSTVTVDSTFSGGRIWSRTGCDDSGNCATGQCPGGLSCTDWGTDSATLLQLTVDGYAGQDYIAPTAGDGFNVPLTLTGCGLTLSCSSAGDSSNGCGATSGCPTGTSYTLTFC